MNPKNLRQGIFALMLLLAACARKNEPPAAPPAAAVPPAPTKSEFDLIKASERSRHFAAVARQLELGGTVYGYMDIDGDVRDLSVKLQSVVQQMAKSQPTYKPIADQNFTEIMHLLGLDDVKALGVSSVPEANGFFRNRTFIYTPEGRRGLLAALGGKAGPFTRLNLAPADTDFYAEAEIDVPVLYTTVKAVVTKVAGEPASGQMEAALRKAGEAATISFLDLIYGLKGHSAIVLRLDPQKNISLPVPGGATLPAFSLLIAVDGVGPVIEPLLSKSPMLRMTQVGGQHVYESVRPLPLEGIQPVIVVEGAALYFATTREFLTQCREQKSGLAQVAEFQTAVAHVGAEGNGLVYMHPRLFSRIRQLDTMNPKLPPDVKQTLQFILGNIPSANQPLVSVRTNLPDGVLVRSHWPSSLKQDILMVAVYNPVTIGFMAAMAVPAFQKVRTNAQEKAVLNNLRQLSAAADQYFLEHGVSRARYADLVGPDKYVRRLQSVAGEKYSALEFVQGQPLRVELANGKVVEYTP